MLACDFEANAFLCRWSDGFRVVPGIGCSAQRRRSQPAFIIFMIMKLVSVCMVSMARNDHTFERSGGGYVVADRELSRHVVLLTVTSEEQISLGV
jgi:hypothetical protein